MWAPVGTVTTEVEFLVKGLHLLHHYTAVMTTEISDRSVPLSYEPSYLYLYLLSNFLLYSLPTSSYPLLLSPFSLFPSFVYFMSKIKKKSRCKCLTN